MIFVIIFILLLLLLTGFCYAIYRWVFHSPRKGQNDEHRLMHSQQMQGHREEILEKIDYLRDMSYEPVRIQSYDGLSLRGRYYQGENLAPLVIGFHGYRGSPAREFCGGGKLYLDKGFHLLLVEQRAHGRSQGHTICYGIKERQDVLSWVRYGEKRLGPDTSILLAGVSMGAATVIMAEALQLPPAVKGIIADCPYSNQKALFKAVMREMKLPADLLYPLLRLSARVFGGFDPEAASAEEAAAGAKVPILLIHGEEDKLVPCEMSRRIAAANPERISLHTFPGADHAMSFIIDEKRYVRLLNDFLKQTGLA